MGHPDTYPQSSLQNTGAGQVSNLLFLIGTISLGQLYQETRVNDGTRGTK